MNGINILKHVISGVEMKGTQNSKTGNLEKPFPGCLGRMVNVFDLSTSVAGNRLLTDKPHRNGDFHCLLSSSSNYFVLPNLTVIDKSLLGCDFTR